MYESNTRIAKNTLLLYFRSAIILLINLYTSRVVLEALGVNDYGIYNLVGGIVGMFSMIGSTLTAASQRFITFALGKGDFNHLKAIFSTCVTLHIILGIILIVVLEIVGLWMLKSELNIPVDRISVAKWVFQFSLFTFFINLISVPYNAVIIAHEKMSAFAYISVLDAVLKLGIAYLLIIGDFDKLLVYSLLHFAVAFIIRVIYTLYSHRHFKETNNFCFRIEKTVFKDMFAFSSWNLIGSSALVLRNQGIDIILNIFFGVVVNAAKGLAYQIQGAVQLFISNFTTAINPQLTSAIAQKNYGRASSLILHGGRISFMMMMMVAVPFIMCADFILKIWLVNPPIYVVGFVRLTIIMLLCDTLSRLLKNGILAHGEIRNFQILAGGIKLLSLPITYLFLRLGGSPYTGFIVNIVIEFIALGLELYYIKAMIGFNVTRYISKAVIPCWIAFVSALTIAYLFMAFISEKTIYVVLVSILSSFCAVLFIAESKEIKLIINPIKAKLKK